MKNSASVGEQTHQEEHLIRVRWLLLNGRMGSSVVQMWMAQRSLGRSVQGGARLHFTFRACWVMSLARHHSYKLWQERRKDYKTPSNVSEAMLFSRGDSPSKSTRPSPFRSTSRKMSSASFRPTWWQKHCSIERENAARSFQVYYFIYNFNVYCIEAVDRSMSLSPSSGKLRHLYMMFTIKISLGHIFGITRIHCSRSCSGHVFWSGELS